MEKILYLAHTDSNGQLPRIALEVLSAAQKLSKDLAGSTLTAGLIGGDVKSAADQIAGSGAVKIFGVSGAILMSPVMPPMPKRPRPLRKRPARRS